MHAVRWLAEWSCSIDRVTEDARVDIRLIKSRPSRVKSGPSSYRTDWSWLELVSWMACFPEWIAAQTRPPISGGPGWWLWIWSNRTTTVAKLKSLTSEVKFGSDDIRKLAKETFRISSHEWRHTERSVHGVYIVGYISVNFVLNKCLQRCGHAIVFWIS